MTPEGYNKITATLAAAKIAFEVKPVPQPGENIRFVDIRTNNGESHAHLLNTLGNAGLISTVGQESAYDVPELSFVSSELRIVAGNDPRPPLEAAARFTTFEDLAATQVTALNTHKG